MIGAIAIIQTTAKPCILPMVLIQNARNIVTYAKNVTALYKLDEKNDERVFNISNNKNQMISLLDKIDGTLPFHVQRLILDFHPNLPYFKNKMILCTHFRRKYCKTCGEYIDYAFPKKNTILVPRHIHSHRARYEDHHHKYVAVDTRLFMNLTPYEQTVMSYTKYKTKMMNDVETYYRLIFRVKGKRNFFRIHKIVNGRSLTPLHMVNVGMQNIFWNPDCYLLTEFMYKTHHMDMDQMLSMKYFTVKDLGAYTINPWDRICTLLRTVLRYQSNLIPVYFKLMMQDQYMFDFFLEYFPQTTMEMLSFKPYVPDAVLKRAIHKNVHLLEYLEESKLKQLFAKDKEWFLELYFQNPDSRQYISFDTVDVLEESLPLRP